MATYPLSSPSDSPTSQRTWGQRWDPIQWTQTPLDLRVAAIHAGPDPLELLFGNTSLGCVMTDIRATTNFDSLLKVAAMLDSAYRNIRVTPEEISQLIARQTRHQGQERRADQRYSVSLALPARPLNDALQPTMGTINMLTRDISQTGAGLLSPLEVRERYLWMQFPELEVVGEVIWREMMAGGGFQRLGVRFLMR